MEHVRYDVPNGVESFRSMLKRRNKGIHHRMSPKHLDRYVQEFADRHNILHNTGTLARWHVHSKADTSPTPT